MCSIQLGQEKLSKHSTVVLCIQGWKGCPQFEEFSLTCNLQHIVGNPHFLHVLPE